MYKIKLGELEFYADVPSPNRDVVEFVTGFRNDTMIALQEQGSIVEISLQEAGSDQTRTGRGKLTEWRLGEGGTIQFEEN